MIGPSAIGSENGTPSSMTSAPASSSPCSSSPTLSGVGMPGRDVRNERALPRGFQLGEPPFDRVHAHVERMFISATCATSLSPRPLTQSSTGSSVAHRPRCDAIQLTACAVSSAGMMPSSRLSS